MTQLHRSPPLVRDTPPLSSVMNWTRSPQKGHRRKGGRGRRVWPRKCSRGRLARDRSIVDSRAGNRVTRSLRTTTDKRPTTEGRDVAPDPTPSPSYVPAAPYITPAPRPAANTDTYRLPYISSPSCRCALRLPLPKSPPQSPESRDSDKDCPDR